MIKEVNGNLLTYPGISVIAHQTNCLGVMGGGIAKQIKARNPEFFKRYYHTCKSKKDAHNLLGKVQVIKSDDGSQYIANLFGEYSFCESIAPYEEGGKPRHTDYDALSKCLSKLHSWLVEHNINTVGIPRLLGCGLAGGDWNGVVYPMVKAEFEKDEDIIMYIVNFK